MTRFLYLSDTHFGTDATGFSQQPAYPAQQAILVSLLSAWIAKQPHIDFLLHGGDMIDAASPETIRQAASLYTLPIPVYLCLGNHDLTHPQAGDWWLQYAPAFFPSGDLNFEVVSADCVLHVSPNQWGPTPYCWEDEQTAAFLPDQTQHLQGALAQYPDRPHILSTHAPARGLPTGQTGFDKPYHSTTPAFEDEITALAGHCHDLRLVLSAHSHLNMHVHQNDTHYVSSSSFIEAPFEFKLIECKAGEFTVSTHNLAEAVPFSWRYDYSKTYVQGRPIDRAFQD